MNQPVFHGVVGKPIKGNMAASMGASSQACEYLDLVHSVMEASRAGRDVRSRDQTR